MEEEEVPTELGSLASITTEVSTEYLDLVGWH